MQSCGPSCLLSWVLVISNMGSEHSETLSRQCIMCFFLFIGYAKHSLLALSSEIIPGRLKGLGVVLEIKPELATSRHDYRSGPSNVLLNKAQASQRWVSCGILFWKKEQRNVHQHQDQGLRYTQQDSYRKEEHLMGPGEKRGIEGAIARIVTTDCPV